MVTAPERATNGNGTSHSVPDLSHHINRATRARQPNMLKKMYPYLVDPNMVSLGGGLPHPSTFPIHKASFELSIPPNFDGSAHDSVKHNDTGRKQLSTGVNANGVAKGEVKRPETPGRTTMSFWKHLGPNGEHATMDLAHAQQYSRPMGFQPLRQAFRDLTVLLHQPKYDDFEQIPTGGNTDATTKIFKALLENNDTLLVEEHEFAPPCQAALALGAGVRGVQLDAQGIVPEALDELLSNWQVEHRGKKPHVLYTVPTGQNPTSATMTAERAHAVYEIACKHDLVIVEDDPYFWIALGDYVGPAADEQAPSHRGSDSIALDDVRSLEDFVRSMPTSYLSIDTEGRVIRCDSFSKCFAPGMRTGWMTGNPVFIERIQRIAETDSQEISGLGQAFFSHLLSEPSHNITNESWGMEGFARWIVDLRKQYRAKRDRLVNGIARECKSDYIRCKPVAASGMFLWLEVRLDNHPDYCSNLNNNDGSKTNSAELMQRCFECCIEEGVLILQSSIFATVPRLPLAFQPKDAAVSAAILRQEQADIQDTSRFLRACFAGSMDQLDTAAARMGKALERFFGDARNV